LEKKSAAFTLAASAAIPEGRANSRCVT